MIDTHCHIDLYENPHQILKECEIENIITIAMTNLPSHFQIGFPHVKLYKNVRLALGMHPLFANKHEDEFPFFVKNIDKTSYIGEIGLDFSNEGILHKDVQITTFKKILGSLKNKKKILSIHSRKAEKEILNLLIEYNISNAIFHWYSGPLALIDKIIEAGFYFSINPSMIMSENGKKIISRIPLNRLLTESDGPFIKIEKKIIRPKNVNLVINYLAYIYNIPELEIENIIKNNFKNMIAYLKMD